MQRSINLPDVEGHLLYCRCSLFIDTRALISLTTDQYLVKV